MKKFGKCPICDTELTRGNTTLGPISILYTMENGVYTVDERGTFRMRVRICTNCFKNIDNIEENALIKRIYKGYNSDSENNLSKLRKKKRKDPKEVSEKELDRKITEYINDGKPTVEDPAEIAKKKQKKGFWSLFRK